MNEHWYRDILERMARELPRNSEAARLVTSLLVMIPTSLRATLREPQWRAFMLDLVRQIDQFAEEHGEASFCTSDARNLLIASDPADPSAQL